MPRLFAAAPDLAVSPDGAWAAELSGGVLRLFELRELREHRDAASGERPPQSVLPLAEADRPSSPGQPGRIFFLTSDRLLHLWHEPAAGDEPDAIHAELLAVPTLDPIARPLRASGALRVLGAGPAGVVLAPKGSGADILSLRGSELALQRTFTRGEVLSAVPAPDRRFLFEQRTGYDLWDPAVRKVMARLVLSTRQAAAQIGYIAGGKMLWALTGSIPVHVEVFRASDGRRMLELDQPGRALVAEATASRLVIAVEEREGVAFLDVDLAARGTRRVPLPPTAGKLLSFALRGTAAPEILALVAQAGPAGVELATSLLRLPLVRPPGRSAPIDDRQGRSTARPPQRGAAAAQSASPSASPSRTQSLRQGRPESRLIRRGPSFAEPVETTDLIPTTSHGALDDGFESPRAYAERSRGEQSVDLEGADLDGVDGAELDGDGSEPEPAAVPVEVLGGSDGPNLSPARREPALVRVFDPAQSPAAWQWELARWAQNLLTTGATDFGAASQIPDGGPLQLLAMRTRMSPIGQRVVGLLYAAQYLLASRPRGMRPIELALCLGALYDEPAVLGELTPHGALRSADLIRLRPDGRLRLRADVGRMLAGAPCPELLPPGPGGSGREPLPPGLHLVPGPLPRSPGQLCSQPLLRVDGLSTSRPLQALELALRRAQLFDAAVIVDGLPSLSYPAFSALPGDLSLGALRALLHAPRVPVLLCAIPDAVAALGLAARPLGAALVQALVEAPAPLLPSAALPVGTSWRPPTLPATAASPGGAGGAAQTGRLEPVVPGDRRAAILLNASAVPEAYAFAAYLAARDGAILTLDAELTAVRAMVLAMLLRQLPVVVAATPPGGPGAPWPPLLAPFAASGAR